jgi:hypothetical protein
MSVLLVTLVVNTIKLEKTFQFRQRSIYNPPEGSPALTKNQVNILDLVQNDIIHFKDLGNIMLFGDFNARTGNASDFIPDDHNQFFSI